MKSKKNILSRTAKPPRKPHQQVLDELQNKYRREPFVELANEVLEMFESEYNQQLHQRKAAALIKYSKARKQGFFYQEIGSLTKLLNYAVQGLFSGIQEMSQAIIKVLQVQNPVRHSFFNIYNNSDQLKYLPEVPDFLNALIPLLNYERHTSMSCESLRLAVISFLSRFASEGIEEIMKKEQSYENKRNQGSEASPIQNLLHQGTKNLKTIYNSQIVNPVCDALKHYIDTPQFLHVIMQFIANCLLYQRLAFELVNRKVLDILVKVIFSCKDFRSSVVKLCLEIIWNAIDAIGTNAILSFATSQIVQNFKELFRKVMREGYKLQDKCLRNQLLILINYLMSDPNSLQYFLAKQEDDISFLECLLGCATIDQQTLTDPNYKMADKKAEYGTNIQDLEFKKLIWTGIMTAVQSNNLTVLDVIKQVNFIKYLLLYIDPMTTSYAVTRWSAPQLRQIQLNCLTIISNLIAYLKDDFQQKKGLFCLTKFLANTSDPQRRELCLKAFNNASLFEESYKLKIAEEGVMDNLIQFLQHNDQNSLQIKELCFSIISNLCKDCAKNKKLFRTKGGIDLIISNLKDPNLATSSRYILYAVSILDCLWNAILGSRKSESLFLDNQGLYVLLEFLQICDNLLKKLALSSLSYLIQNPKSVPYFCDWSSERTMINATQLLIKIYSKQDQRFGVKYEDGIITNFKRPLTPAQPKSQKVNMTIKASGRSSFNFGESNDAGTQAYLIRKMRQRISNYDLRAIVFSVLYRTGFDKNDLQAGEQQMIEVIQMYPHFRIGQIWCDIENELNRQGIKPTFDDEHWMRTCIQEFSEQVLNCVNTQGLINRQYKKMQEEELQKFLQVIKNNKVNK